MAHTEKPRSQSHPRTAGRTRSISRRAFTAGALALGSAAYTGRAHAQGRAYRIVFWHQARSISEMREDTGLPMYRAFFEELRTLGFSEGRNLKVDFYSSEGHADRYPSDAQAIVDSQPDVILPNGAVGSQLLLGLTRTIPVVSPSFSDPVGAGLVTSLARPGGNLTGFTIDGGPELHSWRLELLKETVPAAKRVGFLTTKTRQSINGKQDEGVLEQTASVLGIGLAIHPMEGPFDVSGYSAAFSQLSSAGRIDGLYVGTPAEHLANRKQIIGLATATRLPAVFCFREFPLDGGLMAYGTDMVDVFRRAAGYVARILKGEQPGDLPIQQPTKYELAINATAARAIGLEIPVQVLARADTVIE